MPTDDLHLPLGSPAAGPAQGLRGRSLRALSTFAVCTLGVAAAAWVWANDDGHGGRPRVVVEIEPAESAKPAALASTQAPAESVDGRPTGSIPIESGLSAGRRSGEEVENSSGVRVVRSGEGGGPPGALIIRVPESPSIALAPAPDRQLVEKSAHGLLPKIGADGRRPLDTYSRPVMTSPKLPADAPRIAIMVGGMGLSLNATRNALEKLPPAVTLAFAPYGASLAGQAASARDKGHEIILQAPMEAFDLAGDGPGPHMLRTMQDKAELKNNLHWLMSRFPGYIGVANFLGAKFLSDTTAVATLVEEAGGRGLMLFDDGTSPQSLLPKIAAASATPYALADVVIDANRDGAAIEKALLRLEASAREKGSAIGVATGLPEVVERVGRFVNGLERRGVALVPVSALAVRLSRPAARLRVSP